MNKTVVIRGAGDIASGIACRLHNSGFKVIMLDIEQPLVIRRTVSFADAIFTGKALVEGIEGVCCSTVEDIKKTFKENKIPVIIDGTCEIINKLDVDILVDAILAKKNLGTHIKMAPIVIGVGPGFTAGEDTDVVIETSRGHYLGKVIQSGSAIKDTGQPGSIMGHTLDRVIKANDNGNIIHIKKIGDNVSKGEAIARISDTLVTSKLDGVLRGLIREGIYVTKGLKIADTDPRGIKEYCYEISEKARAIGGGVLEAILYLSFRR
ncbi:MAG: selenium-dependent molybdenum cofactor biosynthesis protein YqeB [Clostridium sp.]